MKVELTDKELDIVINAVQYIEGEAADAVRYYEGDFDQGMWEHHTQNMTDYRNLLDKLMGANV